MKKILMIGDSPAIYHPLENIIPVKELLGGYDVIFTNDYDDFLRINNFHLCICYIDDWFEPFKDKWAIAIKNYVANGGKMLIIHNGISLQNSTLLLEMLQAKFTHHPEARILRINMLEHQITNHIESFEIFDEPYHYEFFSEVKVIAYYEFDGKNLPAGWENKYGAGTIVYLMPGHNENIFKVEAYQKLIINAINYLLK